ncbi:MAG: exodeoxyribonuclease III [Eggerthellaceae bacterium]|nr:exodeoxyribonuclease III [Eggerthellaceae bacterium]
MKCVSWNVNGLRAVMGKGFLDILESFDADVFALQEIKLQEGQIELDIPEYHQNWSYAERKGYSGTAVFSKEAPLQVLHHVGVPELDTEGRICACEFENFWFVDVYTPNAQQELARIDHRLAWDAAFRNFCKNLEQGIVPTDVPDGCSYSNTKKKPVIMCGDFNVAHKEIDLKNPKTNKGNPGFSDEERKSFGELLDAGFVDTFRALYPDKTEIYSWWSYRFNARKNNAGWSIDYFLTSESLQNSIEEASIHTDVMGSDHCPVSLEVAI